MKTTELIKRIKSFNEDRKKIVLAPGYKIVEPFYIVFQSELAGILEVNVDLFEALKLAKVYVDKSPVAIKEVQDKINKAIEYSK